MFSELNVEATNADKVLGKSTKAFEMTSSNLDTNIIFNSFLILSGISIKSFLLSMKFMTILVLTFFIAVAYATFIENDYGTQTAKALVYNAHWFEVIIVLLNINMLYNIRRYNLLRKEKWPVLLFHISFIVITIGAGITRYVSFEGTMSIRENDSSNLIVSDQTFLQFKVHNNKFQYEHDTPILLHDYNGPLSFLKSNHFKNNLDFSIKKYA